MAAEANPSNDARCPRCGGAFHCGMHDPTPCACTTLQLSRELLGALRRDFAGCLCISCLQELSAGSSDMERDQFRGQVASRYSG